MEKVIKFEEHKRVQTLFAICDSINFVVCFFKLEAVKKSFFQEICFVRVPRSVCFA